MKSSLRISLAMFSLVLLTVFDTGCSRRAADVDSVPSAAGTSSTDTSTASNANSDTSTLNANQPSTTAANDSVASDNTLSSGTSTTADSGTSYDSSGSSVKQSVHSVGAVIDDAAITAKVKAALLADSDLKSLGISTSTHNNEVILTGTAENQTQIDRAATIARGVDGVKAVDNKLTIQHG